MDVEVLVTPGLGDNSYLVSSGGEAVLIDPQRDVERFLTAAASKSVVIREVLETHVHNDYVSGALEIRAATGADLAGPAGGRYEFPIRGLSDGDDVKVGDLRLVAMETPGHTPEHLSYLVFEDAADTPAAVFTGGSLMVGGAGRTDLLGAGLADELARAQYRTLHRLAHLPDEVEVYPTHGAGSFCGTGPAPRERTSTIGTERRLNRALAAGSEDAFVRQQLSDLMAYPAYYRHMAPINRSGPGLVSAIQPPRPLSPDQVARLRDGGAWVVDGRWRVPFARAHIPGSINVELDDTFGSYVGWVMPFAAPLLMVLPDPVDESLGEATTQLLRVGYERVEGYLAGGIGAWRDSGRPVASYRVAGLEELCRARRAGRVAHLLDVRQEVEWDRGRIPNSTHVFVGDLPDRLGDVPRDGEVWTICATGHRAALASSLLDRDGIAVRLVEGTGVDDFLRQCSDPL
ncbi:MAG: MBL fold metallo-hydrolase [Actinobacteria bacterium]|nr:MAG: MBL fold metallo-hydrolase [Actinomycetota bacterium]